MRGVGGKNPVGDTSLTGKDGRALLQALGWAYPTQNF